MPTIVIDPHMNIDLPRKSDADDCYAERQEVARVRVMERASGLGEMIGWLQFLPDEEGSHCGQYRLAWDAYFPDLGDWLTERSGVDNWRNMVASEEVWKAVIARFA